MSDDQGSQRTARLGEYPGTTIATVAMGVAGTAMLFVLAWRLGAADQERYLNLVLCLLGASLGTTVAVLSTPFSAADKARFTDLGKAVSAFGSGYLISKFDKVLETALSPEKVLRENFLLYLLLFVTGFVVMGMWVLSSRLYINQRRREIRELKTGPAGTDSTEAVAQQALAADGAVPRR